MTESENASGVPPEAEGQDWISLSGISGAPLDGFELRIPTGSLTFVLGGAGAGKSALLRLILRESRESLQQLYPWIAGTTTLEEQEWRVESVQGLLPAILMDPLERPTTELTIGALSGLSDLTQRLLRAYGVEHCPNCGDVIREVSLQKFLERLQSQLLMTETVDSELQLLFGVSVRALGNREQGSGLLRLISDLGFHRARLGDRIYRLEELTPSDLGNSSLLAAIYTVSDVQDLEGLTATTTSALDLLKSIGVSVLELSFGTLDSSSPNESGRIFQPRNSQSVFYSDEPYCSACGEGHLPLDEELEAIKVRPQSQHSQGEMRHQLGGRSIFELGSLSLGAVTKHLLSVVPERSELREGLESVMELLLRFAIAELRINSPAQSLLHSELLWVRLVRYLLERPSGFLFLVDHLSAVDAGGRFNDVHQQLSKLCDMGNSVLVALRSESSPVLDSQAISTCSLAEVKELRRAATSTSGASTPSLLLKYDPVAKQLSPLPEMRGAFRLLMPESAERPVLLAEVIAAFRAQRGQSSEAHCAGAGHEIHSLEDLGVGWVTGRRPTLLFELLQLDAAIAELYAKQRQARHLGLEKRSFRLSGRQGSCERCRGSGITVDKRLTPRMESVCPNCLGDRFRPEVLSVTVGGASIAQLLELSLYESAKVLALDTVLASWIRRLCKLGLGGLTLGRTVRSLSSSEIAFAKLLGVWGLGRSSCEHGGVILIDRLEAALSEVQRKHFIEQLEIIISDKTEILLVESTDLSGGQWPILAS